MLHEILTLLVTLFEPLLCSVSSLNFERLLKKGPKKSLQNINQVDSKRQGCSQSASVQVAHLFSNNFTA